MAKPTTRCLKCSKDISNNNIAKHVDSCNGPKVKKIRGVDFDPNYGYKDGTRVAWNKGLTKEDARVKLYVDTARARGVYLEKTGFASKDWYDNGGREKLVANGKKNGGYKEKAGHSKKFKVLDSFGKETTLQSTYELRCSEILNELDIKWVRPKALKYDGRNYFADFYLTEFDVWLDPKNSYKAKQDEEKIRKVTEQNNVKLYVLLDYQLTKEYIAGVIYG